MCHNIQPKAPPLWTWSHKKFPVPLLFLDDLILDMHWLHSFCWLEKVALTALCCSSSPRQNVHQIHRAITRFNYPRHHNPPHITFIWWPHLVRDSSAGLVRLNSDVITTEPMFVGDQEMKERESSKESIGKCNDGSWTRLSLGLFGCPFLVIFSGGQQLWWLWWMLVLLTRHDTLHIPTARCDNHNVGNIPVSVYHKKASMED